jgi:RNA-directed DNA polymerase
LYTSFNSCKIGISKLRWGGGLLYCFVMKSHLTHTYKDIVCLENLLAAWQEFVRGKKKKQDVQVFSLDLMDNIVALHEDLANHTYCHGGYHSFFITDPKRRHIHKASVSDRLLHHAVYRILYPFFDRTFIANSYSCRKNKGTHKAINRFRSFAYQVSKNHTRTCWVLKCDIKQFFASVDHEILFSILKKYVPDQDILWLLSNIIKSFRTEGRENKGLPLGNLTSQLFINIYMNVFDRWVKHESKEPHYIRYADGFVILSNDRERLENYINDIRGFLFQHLRLTLHPNKVSVETMASGGDFLGWIQFEDHRTLRSTTRRRMFSKIKDSLSDEVLQSYLGLLKHGNTKNLRQRLLSSVDSRADGSWQKAATTQTD